MVEQYGVYWVELDPTKIHAEHMVYIRDKMNRMLSEYTGQPLEKIQQDTERDNYLTAQQAKEYGLIDEVIAHR